MYSNFNAWALQTKGALYSRVRAEVADTSFSLAPTLQFHGDVRTQPFKTLQLPRGNVHVQVTFRKTPPPELPLVPGPAGQPEVPPPPEGWAHELTARLRAFATPTKPVECSSEAGEHSDPAPPALPLSTDGLLTSGAHQTARTLPLGSPDPRRRRPQVYQDRPRPIPILGNGHDAAKTLLLRPDFPSGSQRASMAVSPGSLVREQEQEKERKREHGRSREREEGGGGLAVG